MEFKTVPHLHNSEAFAGTEEKVTREKRVRMFKAGIASYQNNSITVDCIVRDLTSSGAKLKFAQGAFVPGLFMLTIPVDGVKVDCEVKWRRDLEVGVIFISDLERDALNIRKQSVDVKYVAPKKSTLRRNG